MRKQDQARLTELATKKPNLEAIQSHLDIVVNRKDELAQYCLMDCLIQVFPGAMACGVCSELKLTMVGVSVHQVLQDVVGRPFLCLSDELFEKMKWRSIIICLAFSPVMFIGTRALLHRWFLLTGLASVLELQVELVSMMLDLLSRPMRWGLSVEIGSKLPFSYAYFLFKHQLFRILAGPLSRDRFLELVLKIKKSVSNTKKKLKHVASATSMVDHKSSWSMAMNFPSWFYFAALLLPGNNLSDSYVCRVDEDSLQQLASCSAAAAWYIAWILDPVDESRGCLSLKLIIIISC